MKFGWALILIQAVVILVIISFFLAWFLSLGPELTPFP